MGENTLTDGTGTFFPGANSDPIPEPSVLDNDLRGAIWSINRADPAPIKNGRVFIQSIAWQGYSDADHHVLLKDGFGNIIFESDGSSELSPVFSNVAGASILNPTLTHMDSGVLSIEVE